MARRRTGFPLDGVVCRHLVRLKPSGQTTHRGAGPAEGPGNKESAGLFSEMTILRQHPQKPNLCRTAAAFWRYFARPVPVRGRGRGDRDTGLNELKDSSAAGFCNDCTAPEFASNKSNEGFPCSPAAKMSSSESGLPKKSGTRCSPRRLGHAIREIGSENW